MLEISKHSLDTDDSPRFVPLLIDAPMDADVRMIEAIGSELATRLAATAEILLSEVVAGREPLLSAAEDSSEIPTTELRFTRFS